ncbi:hypothetical protein Tco_1207497 [Tanacetum coccineum]
MTNTIFRYLSVTQSCESYGSDTSLAKSLTEESKFNTGVKRSESVAIGADVIMAVEEKTKSQGGWGDSCDKKKDDNKPQDGAEGSSEQTNNKGSNWGWNKEEQIQEQGG